MDTLQQLQSGELKGIKRLTLSENLTTFPMEILTLSDTLEILDLSHNQLSTLPKEIAQLKHLKIAFFSNNLFEEVPDVFRESENLYMLGFKSNQIERFDEDILPPSISWLILTDNKLKSLPNSIGVLTKLQKCALSGNQLESLPESMRGCQNLELIRLSANNLSQIPEWLLELPKLSWLAFSGNPCAITPELVVEEVEFESLEFGHLLGEGASGAIHKGYATTLEQDVAIKLFKGAITSDGYAIDEMNAYLSIGAHPHLIQVLAKINNENQLGLVLELIPDSYTNLGLPPSLESCTRDTFVAGMELDIDTVYSITKAILYAAQHLHEKGLKHGDLYAHNILINLEDNHTYFGDFGAATFYDRANTKFEQIEVRAFGCLIEDLLGLCNQKDDDRFLVLEKLRERCMVSDVSQRPLFREMDI